jgi:hypothetical protein
MRLWFGGLGLITVVFAISLARTILSGEEPMEHLIWILFPIDMAAFGCLLILFGRLLARRESWKLESGLNTYLLMRGLNRCCDRGITY